MIVRTRSRSLYSLGRYTLGRHCNWPLMRRNDPCPLLGKLQVLPPPHTLSKVGILSKSNFDLERVNGKVKLTKSVVIKPFQTVHVSGLTECSQHFKRVHVIVESDPKREYGVVIPVNGYTVETWILSDVCRH